MRPEKHGTQRAELSLGLLDEAIAADAFVRVIDLFVDRFGDLKTRNWKIEKEGINLKIRRDEVWDGPHRLRRSTQEILLGTIRADSM